MSGPDGIPGWLPTKGGGSKLYRCESCGAFGSGPHWLFFASRTVSTRCLCEVCVEAVLEEAEAES